MLEDDDDETLASLPDDVIVVDSMVATSVSPSRRVFDRSRLGMSSVSLSECSVLTM